MRAALQKSTISADLAFEIKQLNAPHFDPHWHFHKEYQIFVVLEGTGTRFVGDHVAPFKKGDLIATGPDLPHLWRSDQEFFENNTELITRGIVIYFQEDFLGNDFLNKQEMYKLRQFLLKSERGIAIFGRIAEEAIEVMHDLLNLKDFEKVIRFLQLLNLLINTADYKLLASSGYSNSLKPSDTNRMNDVHQFVMKNFRERISLQDVAAIANMTTSSFSRYFKTHANKTFSEFLTEIRVGHSCKLIIDKKMSISEACYESGFNTLSNYNRQFKSVTQHSPLEYRKKYMAVTFK